MHLRAMMQGHADELRLRGQTEETRLFLARVAEYDAPLAELATEGQ